MGSWIKKGSRCGGCGKGLRYGNVTNLCRACFCALPMLLKNHGRHAIREVVALLADGRRRLAADRVGIDAARLAALFDLPPANDDREDAPPRSEHSGAPLRLLRRPPADRP